MFDDSDDQVFTLRLGPFSSPGFHYAVGTNELKFEIQGGALPLGNYRMRFKNTGPTGLRSPLGVPLGGTTNHLFELTSGKGRTGDVITVDLKQSLGGTTFDLPTFGSLTTKVDEEGDVHLLQSGQEIGEIIYSERVEGPSVTFLNSGRFYFVPEAAATLSDANPIARGFQGIINGQSQIDGGESRLSHPR